MKHIYFNKNIRFHQILRKNQYLKAFILCIYPPCIWRTGNASPLSDPLTAHCCSMPAERIPLLTNPVVYVIVKGMKYMKTVCHIQEGSVHHG